MFGGDWPPAHGVAKIRSYGSAYSSARRRSLTQPTGSVTVPGIRQCQRSPAKPQVMMVTGVSILPADAGCRWPARARCARVRRQRRRIAARHAGKRGVFLHLYPGPRLTNVVAMRARHASFSPFTTYCAHIQFIPGGSFVDRAECRPTHVRLLLLNDHRHRLPRMASEQMFSPVCFPEILNCHGDGDDLPVDQAQFRFVQHPTTKKSPYKCKALRRRPVVTT